MMTLVEMVAFSVSFRDAVDNNVINKITKKERNNSRAWRKRKKKRPNNNEKKKKY